MLSRNVANSNSITLSPIQEESHCDQHQSLTNFFFCLIISSEKTLKEIPFNLHIFKYC